jgi:hypothetical protein
MDLKKQILLAFALLIVATHVPAQAIEIKEVNKTVVNTLKILFGAAIATKGVRDLPFTFGVLVALMDAQNRLIAGFLAAGSGVYNTALIAGGVKLMLDGYDGLTEEEPVIA